MWCCSGDSQSNFDSAEMVLHPGIPQPAAWGIGAHARLRLATAARAGNPFMTSSHL